VDVEATEFRQRYQFLTDVNALRERLQRAVNRAESLDRESKKISEILVPDDDDDEAVRAALADLAEALTSAQEPLAGRRSFRDPTLLARASRLFTELGGDKVRQGTLHGPTEVQRSRLSQLNAEADEAIAELEATIDNAVPQINEMLKAKGPLQLSSRSKIRIQ